MCIFCILKDWEPSQMYPMCIAYERLLNDYEKLSVVVKLYDFITK